MNPTHYQTEFDKLINREYSQKEVHPIRQAAFSKFLKIGLPTKKWEEWRFTDSSVIKKVNFKIPEIKNTPEEEVDLSRFGMNDTIDIVNNMQ